MICCCCCCCCCCKFVVVVVAVVQNITDNSFYIAEKYTFSTANEGMAFKNKQNSQKYTWQKN
jgi:hypothetical protein